MQINIHIGIILDYDFENLVFIFSFFINHRVVDGPSAPKVHPIATYNAKIKEKKYDIN